MILSQQDSLSYGIWSRQKGSRSAAIVVGKLLRGIRLAAVVLASTSCAHYPIPGVDQHEHPPGKASDLDRTNTFNPWHSSKYSTEYMANE